MPESDLRPYVERLLRGEFDVGDLTRLLLYARDRSEGRASVREIGDYFAHMNERDRGIVTDEARDYYTQIRVAFEHFNKPYDLSNLPPNVLDAAKASLRRIDPKRLRKLAHVKNKDEAKHHLESFIAKLKRSWSGNLSLASPATQPEIQVFKTLLSITKVQALFTGEKFFDDFCSILVAQNLLSRKELPQMSVVKSGIILSAVEVMHRSGLDIGGGEKANLNASNNGGSVAVLVSAKAGIVPGQFGGQVNLARAMFTTKLLAANHCEADLLSAREWDFPLRVTPAQHLARR